MDFAEIEFLLSAHNLKQLPEPTLPEIAFAGRSNVGKSSLINRLIGRKALVKVSGKPGKTQGLNFFKVAESLYLVDLPGYGFAKVSRSLQESWQGLISSYLESRESLKCVVIIIDLRHAPKDQDTQLMGWLKSQGIPFLPVYTKMDKLSGNERTKNAELLDRGHGIQAKNRVLFSAKTGQGREELIQALASFLEPL